MNNQGLLFIPDISGFTQFITQTEIEHNRHIIQELLETLINSNCLGLHVSEIEGDAILFYRFGKPPSLTEIYKQVETMFCNFHQQLKAYAERRICQCRACKNAQDLTLKVISHYGEFSTYTVKDFSKLLGKDVIHAHQLLKNDIPLHEYWLVTEGWLEDDGRENLPRWLEWQQGSKQTEAEDITFHYTLLTPLKDVLPVESKHEFGIRGHRKQVLSCTRTLKENIDKAFLVVADLSKRTEWMEGLKAVENISTPIPKVGTAHHCVMAKERNMLTTSYFERNEHAITLEETDERGMITFQILLEKKAENITSMTFNVFLKNNIFLHALFYLFMKKKIQDSLEKSMEKLEVYLLSEEFATGTFALKA